MLKKLKNIDNKWFFTELPWYFKLLFLYVKGDLLLLLPFTLLILTIGFFSLRFMGIAAGIYIFVRSLGEMIYWFQHQFKERIYRPHDFFFKRLDNHALYILYQTYAVVWCTIGLLIALYFILYGRTLPSSW